MWEEEITPTSGRNGVLAETGASMTWSRGDLLSSLEPFASCMARSICNL